MKLIITILLSLSVITGVFAGPTDSLQVALSKATSDSARLSLFLALGDIYLMSDTKKAQTYGNQALNLATTIKDQKGVAKALNLVGYTHQVEADYNESLKCHFKALELSEQLKDTTDLINTHIRLGGVYIKIKDHKRARQHYQVASQLAQLTHNHEELVRVYNNLGAIEDKEGRYENALEYYLKGLRLQEKFNTNKRLLAVILLNIGEIHLHLGQPQQGLPYLFRALEVNESVHHKMNMVPILNGISNTYMALRDYDKALTYAHQAYQITQATGTGTKIANSAKLLQSIYAAKKDYANAYQYLLLYTQQDSAINQSNQQQLSSELAAKYETEKKDLENKELRAAKARQDKRIYWQRIALGGVVLLVVLLILAILLLLKSRRQGKAMYVALKQAHSQMKEQHEEILLQKNDLSAQSLILQEQNKQLEANHQFKDKIFSVISHDLRSPFSSIKGILNMANNNALKENDVQRIFGLLSHEVEVAMNMLNNLLIWAKAQLNEAGIKSEEVQVRQMIEENLQLVSTLAEEKNITLQNRISHEIVAVTDKERLNFVLRNLLINAIKFTHQSGTILLMAEETSTHLKLLVIDNGKGIPERHLKKLFTKERFTTLGTSKEKGTGLGLMLCQEFIQSLHGTLMVESEEGKGSTFIITLPQESLQKTEYTQSEPVYLS